MIWFTVTLWQINVYNIDITWLYVVQYLYLCASLNVNIFTYMCFLYIWYFWLTTIIYKLHKERNMM